MDTLKALLKQPYWVIALVLGVALVGLPCVTIDKDYHWAPHSPSTLVPMVVGIALLILSVSAFGYTLWAKHKTDEYKGAGLDLTRVSEKDGVMCTTVSGCEIRVLSGRLHLLWSSRKGDSNMRSAWLCSRNDVIGNLAVLFAALGVFGTRSGWPDVIVAAIMAILGLQGAAHVIRHALEELRSTAQAAQAL